MRRFTAGNVLAKTLRSTSTLTQDVDLNGDADVDSILDLVRGPADGLRILVEESRPMVNVKVDDGLNVHGHVNRNVWGQRRGQGQGQGRLRARTAQLASDRRLLSPAKSPNHDRAVTRALPTPVRARQQ
jgi:hypothetical protein